MDFSGRLAAFSISDLLQWAQNDRRTGALVVRRAGTEKRVYFRDGDIVACLSDDPAEFFGQHLLVRGLVSEGRLVEALTYCRKSGRRLGSALSDLGILEPRAIQAALQEHVEDQVCELFLWRTGIFFFNNESVPADQELPTSLPAAAVALEGGRRADEHDRFRRIFVHDKISLRRGDKKARSSTPLELRVLAALDGETTLLDLYGAVRGSWYRFLDAAYRLTVAGAIDIAEVGEVSDAHSTELNLADLLMEQVAEEQTVLLREHLAVPYEALARCVPVWVLPPDDRPLDSVGEPARDFYARIDGQTDLQSLLAGLSQEERSRGVERLVMQLRDGTLALLPMTVDQLEANGVGRDGVWWRSYRSGARTT